MMQADSTNTVRKQYTELEQLECIEECVEVCVCCSVCFSVCCGVYEN